MLNRGAFDAVSEENLFETLPVETQLKILSYLSSTDVVSSVAGVGKPFNSLAHENSFWQKAFHRHFPHLFAAKPQENDIDWYQAFRLAFDSEYGVYDATGRFSGPLPAHIQNLFHLVKEGDRARLVDRGFQLADLERVDKNKISPYGWALKLNDQALLDSFYWQAIIEYKSGIKIDVTKKDDRGRTILHWAISFRQSRQTINSLISLGADINAACNLHTTPLLLATLYGHIDLIQELLVHNANVHLATIGGISLLYIAAEQGKIDVLNALLEGGASVDFVTSQRNATPLHAAAYQGHLNVVEVLLAYGANANAILTDGKTPLILAVENGHDSVVNTLLDHMGNRVDINAVFRMAGIERTLLQIAVLHGYPKVVDVLLAHGVNVNATFTDGKTSLILAIEHGYIDIVNMLLPKETDLNEIIYTDQHVTLLHYAALYNRSEVIKLLLERGVNVDIACADGSTSLHIAARNKCIEAVEVLLAKGANVNATCPGGTAPLHLAAQAGHHEVVKLLLANAANINATFECNATSLYLAAQNNHLGVVEVLLAQNADRTIALTTGETPQSIAAQKKHMEVIKALLDKNEQQYSTVIQPRLPSSSSTLFAARQSTPGQINPQKHHPAP